MKEVVTMWKNTRMIILVALSAAIYAAFLIVFKGGLVIVPGITEVRPANVFPPIFGLMFGPGCPVKPYLEIDPKRLIGGQTGLEE